MAAVTEELRVSLIVAGTVSDLEELVALGEEVEELRVVVEGVGVEELRVVVRTGVGKLGISNGEGHLGGKEEPFSSDSAFLSPLESSVCATFPTAVNSCSSSGESRRRV